MLQGKHHPIQRIQQKLISSCSVNHSFPNVFSQLHYFLLQRKSALSLSANSKQILLWKLTTNRQLSIFPAQSTKLNSHLKSSPVNTEDENMKCSKKGTLESAHTCIALRSYFISNKCTHTLPGNPLVSETPWMHLSVT